MPILKNKYDHPYCLKTARWISEQFVFQKDDNLRKVFLEKLADVYGRKAAEILSYIKTDYRVFIRDDQMWPDFKDTSWDGAIWCCGRAYGKTWAGSPATIEYAMMHPGCNIGLLAPTFAMGRDNMVMNASGIIALSPPHFKPIYNKSEGLLRWPNGSTAKVFSAENGDRIRGQSFSFVWADEFCFFKETEKDKDLWVMAMMALRTGNVKWLITTSPKPTKAIRNFHKMSKNPKNKIIFNTGTTFQNYTLPEASIRNALRLKGTSIYNQEILGMILDENPNAIFNLGDILRKDFGNPLNGTGDSDEDKVLNEFLLSMDDIVIAVDPAVTEDVESDEHGIVVCGRKGKKGYVIKDMSQRGKISEVFQNIVDAYHYYGATAVVVETNNGGDFIPTAIFNIDEFVKVEKVWASKGKKARAEPIGLLYERKMITHIGVHATLEAQMCDYNPTVTKKSPDRMDAMVWGFTHLFPQSMMGLHQSSNTESLGINSPENRSNNPNHQPVQPIHNPAKLVYGRQSGAYHNPATDTSFIGSNGGGFFGRIT